MAKIYGTPIMAGGAGGANKDLPPLLDNFKAFKGGGTSENPHITIQADKMATSRANELAGAVWVYGDHEPTSVNDGTKIQLTREEVVGSPLSELPSGTKVKLGKWNGEALKWQLGRSTVDGQMFLVLEPDSMDAIGTMEFNAEDTEIGSYPDITWMPDKISESDIQQWLVATGEAGEWYQMPDGRTTAPSYAATYNGFLNQWSDADKQVLSERSWAYTSLNNMVDQLVVGGSLNAIITLTATDRLYESDDGAEDDSLDIFPDSENLATGKKYWQRTGRGTSIHCVGVSGITSAVTSVVTEKQYVRPICAPVPTAVASGPDSDGYYSLTTSQTVSKTITWDSTENFFARQFTYNSKKQYQTMLEGAIATLVLTGVPDPVTELAETHSGSSITLTWKNPTSDEFYDHTVVVYKTDAFPTAIDDGTQGYSGTDETATLSGLELGSTYYIAVFTVSAYGLYGEPQTVQVELPAGLLLSSLASGTKVKLGKWNNTDLQWKVARDTSDQSVRLVLEPTSVSLLGKKMYDNREPSNSDKDRRNFGNNRYIYSNIHQWLNATKATEWYVAQHSADAAPAYSSSPGFLSGWSENHIAALDRATLTTSRASVDGGGTETFVSRVALMSTTELGLESGTGNGRLDIFNSNGDRATGSDYWTRTPHPSISDGVRQVSASGALDMIGDAYNAYGVRPLCIPVSTSLVSMEMDDDNCYIVQ